MFRRGNFVRIRKDSDLYKELLEGGFTQEEIEVDCLVMHIYKMSDKTIVVEVRNGPETPAGLNWTWVGLDSDFEKVTPKY